MSDMWYQIWVKHKDSNTVQIMKRCDPVLQSFGSVPCAPEGTPILNMDRTIEVRSYNKAAFSITKKYLEDQGFIIEREQENEMMLD